MTGSAQLAPLRAIGLALVLAVAAPAHAEAPIARHEVVARYPHPADAFTEGLQVVDGDIYESSGLYRESFVMRWRLGAGQPLQRVALPPAYFAEGLTVHGGKAYVLTWQSNKGLVLDADTFAIEREFEYPGEGWGLTHDGTSLIMSDGTARLRFLDPQTLRQTRTLDVTEDGKPLVYLNELEWVGAGALGPHPRLLANIWQSDQIAVIDPATGVVTARLDLRRLFPHAQRRSGEDVMNGIAIDPRDNTLLITGKRWRYLWRLRLRGPLP